MNPDILLDAAVTRGSATGQFTRRQVLAKGIVAGSVAPALVTALAANPAGDAAVVVSVPVRGRVRVRGYRSCVFVRRHGQSAFKRILAIGRETVGSSPAALAVNGPGDVLVAWDDRTSVRARLISAASKVGREQRLGQGGSAFVHGGRMVAAMDGTRRALVAWMAQRVGEGSYAGSPGIVALAYAPPHGAFAPAQVVQRNLPKGPDRGIVGPAVQTALLGARGVVVWTGYASGRYVVRSVDVTSGRASAPRDLSPAGSDALLRGLAVTSRGGLVAAWSTTIQHRPSALYAAARAAGATTWGSIETVTSTGPDPTLGNAVIAASPMSGEAVLLWSDPLPPGIAAVQDHLRRGNAAELRRPDWAERPPRAIESRDAPAAGVTAEDHEPDAAGSEPEEAVDLLQHVGLPPQETCAGDRLGRRPRSGRRRLRHRREHHRQGHHQDRRPTPPDTPHGSHRPSPLVMSSAAAWAAASVLALARRRLRP
jgi:hypothetical protein